MHVVILGAGRIGQYVAQSLSLDGHSVVLVDMSNKKLQEASQTMDVSVRKGAGTDWKLLEELMKENPELLLALTEEDEVNFVACSIAKSLGNPRTIARAKDFRYAGNSRFDAGRLFHVDHIVLPELLVAEQIVKIGLNQGLYSETFFHGSVFLRTLAVPKGWKHARKTLTELKCSEKRMMIGLIRRKKPGFERALTKETGHDEIIFPHGRDAVYEQDEITIIGDAAFSEDINHFLDVKEVPPSSATIIGGTLVGMHVAREAFRCAL
jgi:trk system potassium uptake protein TrkA